VQGTKGGGGGTGSFLLEAFACTSGDGHSSDYNNKGVREKEEPLLHKLSQIIQYKKKKNTQKKKKKKTHTHFSLKKKN